MEKLPPELLVYVISYIPSNQKINCALVNKRLLAAVVDSLPQSLCIRVHLFDCKYNGGKDDNVTWLELCQCPSHSASTVLFHILPCISSQANCLELEDHRIKGIILDENMHSILSRTCDVQFKRLVLSLCDMSKIQPSTLSLLAQYNKLQEVCFHSCLFPSTESLLIRSISSSFTSLQTIDIKDNKQITDKLARSVARHCPLLEMFSVSQCPSVSTISALSLIETSMLRRNQMLTMHLENTAFDANLLARYMRSPLLDGHTEWRLLPTSISLGYEKIAVLAEHSSAKCVLIYI